LFAPRIYGVVLRAHSVRGAPGIQLNASGEVATVLKLLKAVFTVTVSMPAVACACTD